MPLTPAQIGQQELQLVQMGMHLGNAFAIEHIETYAVAVRLTLYGATWYDTRPMVDPRELPAPALDLAVMALQYAEAAGLVYRHPEQRHLVRIVYRV